MCLFFILCQHLFQTHATHLSEESNKTGEGGRGFFSLCRRGKRVVWSTKTRTNIRLFCFVPTCRAPPPSAPPTQTTHTNQPHHARRRPGGRPARRGAPRANARAAPHASARPRICAHPARRPRPLVPARCRGGRWSRPPVSRVVDRGGRLREVHRARHQGGHALAGRGEGCGRCGGKPALVGVMVQSPASIGGERTLVEAAGGPQCVSALGLFQSSLSRGCGGRAWSAPDTPASSRRSTREQST